MSDAITTLGGGLSSNVDEPEAVAGGEQYEIKLTAVEVRNQKPEKGDGRYVLGRVTILGETGAKPLTHVMMLPDGKDSDADYQRNLALQRFYDAFDISHEDGADIELTEGVGNSTFAILSAKESEGYGMQNGISRFIASE